jgi:hypothetical protein
VCVSNAQPAPLRDGAVNGIKIKKADIKVDNAIMMAIGEVIVI